MRSIFFDASIPRVLATLAAKRLWRNAVFAPTAPLRTADLPTPPLPGPRGVRVANRLAGICASDLHLVYCDVDPLVHPAALPDYERIYLGHEVVGEVVEVGPEVSAVAVGDRVVMKGFLNPTCASQGIDPPCRSCAAGNYVLCENRSLGGTTPGVGGGWSEAFTCRESEVWRVPADLDDDQAMLLEPLSCGVRAALRRLPRPGERAVVIGCGTIGLATLQALRALAPDAERYAVARHRHQRELAARSGAHLLGRDLLSEVATATGGRVYRGELGNRTMLGGADVVYDCVGTGTTIEQALRMTRAGGTVVVAGVHLHRVKLDLTPVWHQEVDLIGSQSHGHEQWQGEELSTFELTARLIASGTIDTGGFITHRFALADWRRAIETATDKRTGAVKVVFEL